MIEVPPMHDNESIRRAVADADRIQVMGVGGSVITTFLPERITDWLDEVVRLRGRAERFRAVLEQVEAATGCDTYFSIIDATSERTSADEEAAERFYAAINAVVSVLADTEDPA